MPHTNFIRVEGRIIDVFAHRFVIEGADRRILADLGPKGAAAFVLAIGMNVIAEGEMKPSELKVSTICLEGGTPVLIAHPAKEVHGTDAGHADAGAAIKAAAMSGYHVVGAPRRKPKHFEVLARKDGALVECHVEFDGTIRKVKAVGPGDDKWASELTAV